MNFPKVIILKFRSRDRSVTRSLGRSIARSLGRSVARSLAPSLARSIARTIARLCFSVWTIDDPDEGKKSHEIHAHKHFLRLTSIICIALV